MPPVPVNKPDLVCRKQNYHILSYNSDDLLKSRLNLNNRIVLFAKSAFLIPCYCMEERKG